MNQSEGRVRRKESGNLWPAGPPGWQEFEKRLEQLRTTLELTCDIEERLPNALKNKYKNREVSGNLLHFAIDYDAMDSSSECIGENVGLVLEQGARVDAWMIFNAFGQEGKVAPIHLAATRGLIPAVKLLVEYAADVNQKSMHAGEPHFCPIHDAAFHQNFEAVDCLLQLHADPNTSNKDGRYPLHIVAENGADEVAELLIQARARLDVELPANTTDSVSTSPFNLAIQRRFFPKERLHLLAPFCYPDYDVNFFHCMVDVCRENIPAAKALTTSILVDDAGSPTELDAGKRERVVKAVKQGCSKGVSPIPSLTEIIKLAPDVACAILDIFLVTPKATSPAHALPRVANLADGLEIYGDVRFFCTPVPMVTFFSPDIEWRFHSSCADRAKQIPPWHHKLVPRARSNEDDCEVQVKYLSFPNILDVRVLHALNSTRNNKVFGSLTVQALTRCSWQCVENVVWMQIVFEVAIIVIHSWWAMVTLALVPIEPTFQDKNPLLAVLNTLLAVVPVQNVTRFPASSAEPEAVRTFHHKMAVTAISVLWASAFRETFTCLCHVVEHRAWGFSWLNFLSGYNMLELLSTFMLGAFLVLFGLRGVNSFTTLLFCVNILIRAVKLLIKLCLTQPVGTEILPIIVSFLPMGRFFFFASMIYFTFLVAFASLRENYSLHHVVTLLFFATWAGDGDSFVGLRQLDRGGNLSLVLLGLAVIAFTVCTLNLMIAIFSKVYKDNISEGTLLFLQHRCSACERVLLELTWKSECRRLREDRDEEDGEEEEDESQSIERRDWLPYIISLVLFAVWLISIAVGSPGPFAIWLAALLAASMVLLQAANMQNTWFNRDYHRQRLADGLANSSRMANGMQQPIVSWMRSDSRGVQIRSPSRTQEYNRALTTESSEQRMAEHLSQYEDDFFIWICHRADFEQSRFCSRRDELRDMMIKLAGTVQKLDSRLNEMDFNMQQLEQRLCGSGSSTKRRSGIRNHDKSSVHQGAPAGMGIQQASSLSRRTHRSH